MARLLCQQPALRCDSRGWRDRAAVDSAIRPLEGRPLHSLRLSSWPIRSLLRVRYSLSRTDTSSSRLTARSPCRPAASCARPAGATVECQLPPCPLRPHPNRTPHAQPRHRPQTRNPAPRPQGSQIRNGNDEAIVACSPKIAPGLVRVPMTPGRGTLETLDEAKTTHS